jgi:hypothetical protein
MFVGDSATAAATGQTGLQGSELGAADVNGFSSGSIGAGPTYERVVTQDHQFNPGTGTGTIREAVISWSGGNSTTGATVRFVLTSPIVKGVLDQLNIEHRVTMYPDVTDDVGTFDLSGTSYDYTMRLYYCTVAPNFTQRNAQAAHGSGGNGTAYDSSALSAITGSGPVAVYAHADIPSEANQTVGGGVGTYYSNLELVFTADQLQGNGDGEVNAMRTRCFGSNGHLGWQYRFVQTTGGANLLKANTHELRLNSRITNDRYP